MSHNQSVYDHQKIVKRGTKRSHGNKGYVLDRIKMEGYVLDRTKTVPEKEVATNLIPEKKISTKPGLEVWIKNDIGFYKLK